MPDDAALAGGVHALQHEQHGAGAAAGGSGVEGLLQVVEAMGQVDHLLGGSGLVPRADGPGARVESGEVGPGPQVGGQPERLAGGLPHGRGAY
ncbi:MAG TPA: hypothetical protein VD903_21690 [Pseudonocardia sp.]|nr:hypothetical protein [Pseudonocardia sp.]